MPQAQEHGGLLKAVCSTPYTHGPPRYLLQCISLGAALRECQDGLVGHLQGGGMLPPKPGCKGREEGDRSAATTTDPAPLSPTGDPGLAQNPEIHSNYRTGGMRQALGCKIQVQVPVRLLCLCVLGLMSCLLCARFYTWEASHHTNSHGCLKFPSIDANPFLSVCTRRGFLHYANFIPKRTQSPPSLR